MKILHIILLFLALASTYAVTKFVLIVLIHKYEPEDGEENVNMGMALLACLCWALIYSLY